ncbi:MAG TPA: acyltransferase [Bacteroidia bacterium]|nr:acyltransferase [Bacteroidia bacterium]
MKLKYIDAIRGIAILLVMMVHTSQFPGFTNINPFVTKFTSMGIYGVQMFFLASAFTLFLSYNTRKTNEGNVAISFYIRRFFRIAPMYYIGIFYFYWQSCIGNVSHNTFGEIISNIFFIHGVNPNWINSLVPGGWSITVEMTFYLIFPYLVQKIKKLNQAINFTIGSYFVAIIFHFLLSKNPLISNELLWNDFLYFNFINQLPVFGLGIILYFIIVKKDIEVV